MKYTFHEGMQKIAREFNFGETTFVLPKKDLAASGDPHPWGRRGILEACCSDAWRT